MKRVQRHVTFSCDAACLRHHCPRWTRACPCTRIYLCHTCLRGCWHTCSYLCLCISINSSHCGRPGPGQLITTGAKSPSSLCSKHPPAPVSHSLTPRVWPLLSGPSCLPHKLYFTTESLLGFYIILFHILTSYWRFVSTKKHNKLTLNTKAAAWCFCIIYYSRKMK